MLYLIAVAVLLLVEHVGDVLRAAGLSHVGKFCLEIKVSLDAAKVKQSMDKSTYQARPSWGPGIRPSPGLCTDLRPVGR